MEQTDSGLQGLPQPEEQIRDCHLAWDKMTDIQLEGEGARLEKTAFQLAAEDSETSRGSAAAPTVPDTAQRVPATPTKRSGGVWQVQ